MRCCQQNSATPSRRAGGINYVRELFAWPRDVLWTVHGNAEPLLIPKARTIGRSGPPGFSKDHRPSRQGSALSSASAQIRTCQGIRSLPWVFDGPTRIETELSLSMLTSLTLSWRYDAPSQLVVRSTPPCSRFPRSPAALHQLCSGSLRFVRRYS
jgi:hypothetical protein